jgi:CRISPR system Cascade subunit CasD
MTFRYYLQDCTFAVLFQIPAGQCDAVAHALQHPVWTLYLGRKNCIPTELIFQGVYQTSEQAKESAEKLAQAKQKCLAYTITQGTGHGEIITVNDVPIQFGAQKRYRDRQVTILAED